MSNFAECVFDVIISDDDAIEIWREERLFRYRNLAGGLTIPEAFAAAMIRARWFPAGTTIRRVTNLQTLPLAPLVVAFSGLDWHRAAKDGGRLEHSKQGANHAVLAVGDVDSTIWVENSHGASWGQNGFGYMSHAIFARFVSQIWQIILPGAPRTLDDSARQQLAPLVEQLRDQVTSLARNLRILGYTLPGDGRTIMADIIRRSLAGQLSAQQQDARRDVTDVYLILQGSGITDAQVNAVWAYINTATQEQP